MILGYVHAITIVPSSQLQRGPVDGGASLLDLRGGRLPPRRPLRPLRLRPPEAARPPHVQAHPETDDVRRLTDNANAVWL